MPWGYCDDKREHERKAERDFDRGHKDRELYSNGRYGDECGRVYKKEWDRLEQEEDERREREEREAREEARLEEVPLGNNY